VWRRSLYVGLSGVFLILLPQHHYFLYQRVSHLPATTDIVNPARLLSTRQDGHICCFETEQQSHQMFCSDTPSDEDHREQNAQSVAITAGPKTYFVKTIQDLMRLRRGLTHPNPDFVPLTTCIFCNGRVVRDESSIFKFDDVARGPDSTTKSYTLTVSLPGAGDHNADGYSGDPPPARLRRSSTASREHHVGPGDSHQMQQRHSLIAPSRQQPSRQSKRSRVRQPLVDRNEVPQIRRIIYKLGALPKQDLAGNGILCLRWDNSPHHSAKQASRIVRADR